MDKVVGFIADDGLNKDGRTTAFCRKLCVYIDGCEGGRYRRRGYVYSPGLNVCVVGGGEGDMPVDTGTGVPSAVAPFVAHADGKDIVAAGRIKVGCEVVVKGRVAVGMIAEVVTVEPDIAVHVDTVEINGDVVGACLIYDEVLAVEGSAADGVAGSGGTDAGEGEGTADTVGLVGRSSMLQSCGRLRVRQEASLYCGLVAVVSDVFWNFQSLSKEVWVRWA